MLREALNGIDFDTVLLNFKEKKEAFLKDKAIFRFVIIAEK